MTGCPLDEGVLTPFTTRVSSQPFKQKGSRKSLDFDNQIILLEEKGPADQIYQKEFIWFIYSHLSHYHFRQESTYHTPFEINTATYKCGEFHTHYTGEVGEEEDQRFP